MVQPALGQLPPARAQTVEAGPAATAATAPLADFGLRVTVSLASLAL